MVPRAVDTSAVARFSTFTTTEVAAEPGSPPVSVIDAVTTWLPALRPLVEKLAPDPITPSRSDDHDRPELMLPSCASVALPLNVIELPRTNVAPAAGASIVTVGAVLGATGFTVTVM